MCNRGFKPISQIIISLFLLSGCAGKSIEKPEKPNILWIMLEDWGLQLSCYGEPGIQTPNIDKLAAEGVRFTNSFSTSPVCSPSRSAMITGFHQNAIGANQHRTATKFGIPKKMLPTGIHPITHYLKQAGYFTAIMDKRKKTDLNFVHDKLFEGNHWNESAVGQPFFAQITFEGTHRKWLRDPENPISIENVRVPPYYPQTDFVKRDWANGLEAMQNVDKQVGALLDQLEKDGLKNNTLVILIGDNGRCMPRGKQFLYDGGLRVPVIIRWPDKIKPGTVRDELISTLDIPKTILDIISSKPKTPLHGKNLFDGSTAKREFIFAARDKMDSTYDASRAIRSKKYKLIHNLMPERPYLQYNQYKENMYPTLAEMNVLYLSGKLNEEQEQFMAASKPEYELFNLEEDPNELNNLAYNPAHKKIVDAYLHELNRWRKSINDEEIDDQFRAGGWPAKYPTRTLEEWKIRKEGFEPWVFRKPDQKVKHPYSRW